ncbi:phosphoribosylamine--glycine ligase [Hathewaya proteolytica DSM 3090]|uniref:Phosphoribosylamine--glycine ligase n=1 Tax=Hathewaya proteolytica DSM 3090 TaxID=1121331 RepID=A0A1M6P619_9CLOT|nr:phosphoribosylamine--glycine ligase [Hathewaya proteolytica]SHK03353.1 phosphoribosylamine--glycine ligase [Hathewaya proteolytica DSM 3090]
MKILLLGSGGREHAIAYKMAQSEKVEKIYVVPGNDGIALEEKCECINIGNNSDIVEFAKKQNIELTVVGPEAPLCDGIVDDFRKHGLKIFGPGKNGAILEGSKAFSKDFMKKYNIRTAEYEVFNDADKALEYSKTSKYPLVIKADGLAAGKGVVIAENREIAEATIIEFMEKDLFKGAGSTIVLEEFLEGKEASILSVTDGNVILPFMSSKDHKQIFDGNKGPNTGGMGVIAPNPYCTEEIMEDFKKNIMEPTLRGIQEEKMDFKGVIFFGIMICHGKAYLLEYNVRMGDPETECVLPMMKTDLVEIMEAAVEGRLKDVNIQWNTGSACTVIAAAEGYPHAYNKGMEIKLQDKIQGKVFFAGVKNREGKLTANGGRVLAVTCIGENLEEAIDKAYENIKKVSFDEMYYRKDIGRA